MHELVTRWAGPDEGLSHELMKILAVLVRFWLLVPEPLNGGPASGLQVRVNVSASSVREACSRASP